MSKELKQLIKHLEGFIEAHKYPRGQKTIDAVYAAEELLEYLSDDQQEGEE